MTSLSAPHPWSDAADIPAIAVWRALSLGFLTIVALALGLGLWAGLATLSGAVVAPGQVEVEGRHQVVQHADGGIVAEIAVHDGDRVEAGQILLRLDGAALLTEKAILDGQISDQTARQARLEAERNDADSIPFPADLLAAAATDPPTRDLVVGQRDLFAARRAVYTAARGQLDARIGQIRAQITGTEAQIASAQTQRQLFAKELSDQTLLFDKGLTQAGRLLALEREIATLDGSIGADTAERAQNLGRIAELEQQGRQLLAQRHAEAENDLRDTQARLQELIERRNSLSLQIERLALRAPTSGLVYGLSVTTPHAVIRAAEPVLSIVPQDRPLMIAARVSPLNIDEIEIGQAVTIRFPAFSGRMIPQVQGRLTRISADAMTDDATHATFYNAEITLLPGQQEGLPHRLLPGMPAEVYIRTGDRSPLSYLLKPFTDYFSRALRES